MKNICTRILAAVLLAAVIFSISGCGGSNVDDDVISQLVSGSLISSNAGMYLEGECAGEGHKILGAELNGNILKVYALTMYGCYGFQNDVFIKVSGSGVIPAVLTFEKNGGEFDFTGIKYPTDGEGYEESIKEMFPLKYRKAALNGYEVYDELKAMEEGYAQAYLDTIGRDAKIGEYSDLDIVLLTDLGVDVEISNLLICDERLSAYPYWIGTSEYLENGVRYIRSMSFDQSAGQIIYKTVESESGAVIEELIFSAETGEEIIGSTAACDVNEESDEKAQRVIEFCRQYLLENEADEIISTIRNFECPELAIVENLPADGTYLKLADDAGTRPYYEVTFTTEADDMLGPIVFIVNSDSEIIGLIYRE